MSWAMSTAVNELITSVAPFVDARLARISIGEWMCAPRTDE